MEQIHS